VHVPTCLIHLLVLEIDLVEIVISRQAEGEEDAAAQQVQDKGEGALEVRVLYWWNRNVEWIG